jgi:phenylpropionate dioxygenase-like ring-hydroxylating dioxygenase large terminal subunit
LRRHAEDFDMGEHGLRRLQVTERNGVIFASFATAAVEPFEQYLGADDAAGLRSPVRRQVTARPGLPTAGHPANWKLIFENVKDPFHATLMHVFLVTFRPVSRRSAVAHLYG